MLKLKPIKAKKIKRPAYLGVLIEEQEATMRSVQADYEKTVKWWMEPAEFDTKTRGSARSKKWIRTTTYTTNKKFGWADRGTRRRTIKPRPDNPSGLLVFPSGFTPSTVPGIIGSRISKTRGPLVFTPIVKGHKIKARKFTPTLKRRWEPIYQRRMRWANAQGAKLLWT